MPFDNPLQTQQEHMIYKASLEKLKELQKNPKSASLTEISIQLIDDRIKQLEAGEDVY
jgi:hypothetical protein